MCHLVLKVVKIRTNRKVDQFEKKIKICCVPIKDNLFSSGPLQCCNGFREAYAHFETFSDCLDAVWWCVEPSALSYYQKADEPNFTSSIKETLSIPCAPPELPCVWKWFKIGISIPSHSTFSFGATANDNVVAWCTTAPPLHRAMFVLHAKHQTSPGLLLISWWSIIVPIKALPYQRRRFAAIKEISTAFNSEKTLLTQNWLPAHSRKWQ